MALCKYIYKSVDIHATAPEDLLLEVFPISLCLSIHPKLHRIQIIAHYCFIFVERATNAYANFSTLLQPGHLLAKVLVLFPPALGLVLSPLGL